MRTGQPRGWEVTPWNRQYQLIITLSLLTVISGCAHFSPSPLVSGITTALPKPITINQSQGAIFPAEHQMNFGYQPLFEDSRPRHRGDTLTVQLQENVSASKTASANTTRKGAASLDFDVTPSMLQGFFGADKANTKVGGGNQFQGNGGAAARNSFTGTITVTVTEVLQNGNLMVVGEKQLAINQGTEFIRFSGVVNPRTITANNSVSSTQIADARIEYVANGYINEAQKMGWLQRLFLNISPF